MSRLARDGGKPLRTCAALAALAVLAVVGLSVASLPRAVAAPVAQSHARHTGHHATSEAPRVAHVSLSAHALPGAGGRIRVAAHLARATRCRLTIHPAVSPAPPVKSCKSGSVAWHATFPANRRVERRSYTLTVKAVGVHGLSASSQRTVSLAETTDPPHIGAVMTGPASVSSQGGPVAVTANLTRTERCTLSVTPAVYGLPSTSACTIHTKTFVVRLPPNPVATPSTYRFTLTATGTHHQAVHKQTMMTVPSQDPTCPGQTDIGQPTTRAYFNDPTTHNAQDQKAVVDQFINLICDVSPPVNGVPSEIDLAMYRYQLDEVTQALEWAHAYRGATVHVALDGGNTQVTNPDGSISGNPAYEGLVQGPDALPKGSVVLCGADAGDNPLPPTGGGGGDGDDGGDTPPSTGFNPAHTSCAGDNILHTKLLLVSSVDTRDDPVVLTSAHNLDTNAEVASFNDALQIVGSSSVYAANHTYFTRVFADKANREPDLGDELGSATAAVGAASATSYFFPRNSPAAFPADDAYHKANDQATDPMVKLLNRVSCSSPGDYAGDHSGAQPRTTVRIAMYNYSTRHLITNRLEALSAAGCDVRIIYTTITSAALQSLQQTAAQYPGNLAVTQLNDHSFPYTDGSGTGHVFVHDKYTLVSGNYASQPNQDVVVGGSENFTETSLHRNDEQMLSYTQTAAAAPLSTPVFSAYAANWDHLAQVAATAAATSAPPAGN